LNAVSLLCAQVEGLPESVITGEVFHLTVRLCDAFLNGLKGLESFIHLQVPAAPPGGRARPGGARSVAGHEGGGRFGWHEAYGTKLMARGFACVASRRARVSCACVAPRGAGRGRISAPRPACDPQGGERGRVATFTLPDGYAFIILKPSL